jgi:outer membrane protein assembly factor BamB
MHRQKPCDRSVKPLPKRKHLNPTGNVLIYVVVLMLIFGVLGVVIVSLFTSSTASTVTRNDIRRARYMAESGMRYAFSEMRKADFDPEVMINTLNTTTYNLNGAGSFTINVFSPWFESPSNQTIGSGGGDLTLGIPVGELPNGYTVPNSNINAVNYEYTGNNPTDEDGSWAPVTNFDDTTTTLTLSNDFYANPDERISLAVRPTSDQQILDGGNLNVSLEAQTIFPKYGGAFNVRRNDYFYEERVDDPDNNQVILRNISKRPEAVWNLPVTAANDLVVLSPRNYLVVPTGTSADTSYGGDYLFGKGIYDATIIRPGSRKPDITAEDLVTSLSEQETDTRFFETELVDYELVIGGGTTYEFGSAFFEGDMSIGGDQDYCAQGACLFSLGVRVFFLLDFDQQGDGITFTLLGKGFGALGPPNNSASSVGGDFQLSELMGYAGDSRLDADGSIFLATNPDDRGLDPPKIAVEFDTRTNNTAGDPPPDYCTGANANTETRNDPLTGNEDAVQYVFWGRTSFLNIPCRGDSPFYDDNRHDADGEEPAEEWRFGTGGPLSIWRPAIGPDGTIYMSALDATLYALNEDGTVKWTFDLTDNNDYMPGIDRTGGPNDGTIYSDIFGSSLVAINPDGTEKWQFLIAPTSDVDSTPTVGPDGAIYFGTDGAQALIALDPNGTERWRFPTGGEVDNVAALSPDGTTVYFVSNDNNLYSLKIAARLADPTGAGGINIAQGEWVFPILTEPGEIQSSPTVNPDDGTIYVGSDDLYVYALKEAARILDPAGVGGVNLALGEWQFRTNGEIESSATLDPDDGTIYIGSDDGNVWAINPDGTEKWRFPTGGEVESSAIVDLDGTIYIGSSDGNVYAINPNGTQKWFFPTGAAVPSSPVIGRDGFIRIGSNNTNFYTISQFGDPRNFKDEDKILGKLLTFEDLDSTVSVESNTDWLNGAGSKGSWAVRLEVDRSLVSDADGQFNYELRLWMRQCPDPTDFPCDDILGTFYQDTRVAYDYTAVEDLPMRQRFRLSGVEQDAFESFFFGFTGAAGAEALNATISQFQLSFIRPGDPVVSCDSVNWPVEAPLADCIPEL